MNITKMAICATLFALARTPDATAQELRSEKDSASYALGMDPVLK